MEDEAKVGQVFAGASAQARVMGSDNSSQIVMLDETRYPPDASPRGDWHTIETPTPSMAQIEEAIRRLDREEWPFVWLHTMKHIDGDLPENALTVMGGRDEYCIFFTPQLEGGDFQPEWYFTDSSRSMTMVHIWESDQGSDVEERYLCNDLDRVLLIVRYFADHAALDPGATWEQRD